MSELEKKLGYKFNNYSLLRAALSHSSYANENKNTVKSNERLEFLGDSVLGTIVAEHLYKTMPRNSEGDLSRTRAALVCEKNLNEVAQSLELGGFLLLGKGEAAGGGRERPSILADAVEAIIAAVYLDGGYDAAREIVNRFILKKAAKKTELGDYKTALQELVQRQLDQVLTYTLVSETGPDHEKKFITEVSLNDEVIGVGEGRSKKQSEQSAAHAAINSMGN